MISEVVSLRLHVRHLIYTTTLVQDSCYTVSITPLCAPDYTHLYLCTCTVTSIGIKQQYQKFHDLGAVDLHIEIEEVGPMGGDNNMAYDRGYVQVLNAQHNVMINGK